MSRKIAFGVSGGIAAYKACEVLRGLQRADCTVRVAMTRNACEFVTPLTFRALSGSEVIVDDFSPANQDPIAHITFAQTVDLFVVAPATANIIAKLANGIADDFLSTTLLATTAPVLIAPAMNAQMWNYPATQRNLNQLRQDGVHIIEPDAGEMACGTFGPGRLSEPELIVKAALELIGNNTAVDERDLARERILITAGATREEIDPVRFISNRSSGRMGFAIARAARERGAEVTVVAGTTSIEPPPGVRLLRAVSAEEMRQAVSRNIENSTVFIGAAAVSDYRPKNRSETKLKKSDIDMIIEMEPTADILAEVSDKKHNGLLVIGFAAETNEAIDNARQKLALKNLDAIIVNDVSIEGAGFDTDTNKIAIIARDKRDALALPLMSKYEGAHKILDEVKRLRKASVRRIAQTKI